MPYYLSIGMAPSDYWEGEANLCAAYREKARLEARMADERAWLQGAYIYEALSNLAPMFGFNRGEVKPYPSRPHSMERQEKRDARSRIQAGKAFMERFTAAHNAAMREKSETAGGQ